MTARALVLVLVWTILVAVCSFLFGCHVQSNADEDQKSKAKDAERTQLKRKNTKALAAGVRVEQVQAAADTAFQQLRSAYEAEQHDDPHAGCVLDPVSLRRWNDANAQSDGGATGEPDAEVPAAAEGEPGPERSQ